MIFTCDLCGKRLRPGRMYWDYYPPRKKDASSRYTRIVGSASIAVGMYCSKKCFARDSPEAKRARWEVAQKGIQSERAEIPVG